MKLLRYFLLLVFLSTPLQGRTQLEKIINNCSEEMQFVLDRDLFQLNVIKYFLFRKKIIDEKISTEFNLNIKPLIQECLPGYFNDLSIEQYDSFKEAMQEIYWDETLQRLWTDQDRVDFVEREFKRKIYDFLFTHYGITLPREKELSTEKLLQFFMNTIKKEDVFQPVESRSAKRRRNDLLRGSRGEY